MLKGLPRNVWAASLTSFLTDVSSEMVQNLLPLFLANALGAGGAVVGLIEGVAEAMGSLLKVASGHLSDRLRRRKGLAVLGYLLSATAKVGFVLATAWPHAALARWGDRLGKGVRTAPRDALIADSVDDSRRGLAFGLHRAADTAGALLGVLAALFVVERVQGQGALLLAGTFHRVALWSLLPAFLAVAVLALWAEEPRRRAGAGRQAPAARPPALGRGFGVFLALVGVFELSNSADAFLALRAQTLGASVVGILAMLALFNLVYALLSTPAGALSDRWPRKAVILLGWLVYALVYLGAGLASSATAMWAVYAAYGVYYGVAYGTTRALIADLVPEAARGTAYGAYATVVGVMAFPASFIAGVLWDTFGPQAPFFFSGGLALLATLGLLFWRPDRQQ